MYEVKFADIGEGLTEGRVAEVKVKVGDAIKAGDPLFSVETDKVNADIPSPTTGKIAQIKIKADQDIKVGDVVIVIDDGQPGKAAPTSAVEEENASVVGATPVSNDVIPSRTPEKKVIRDAGTIKVEAEYDVIVVGAGIGGYIAAIKASQLGLKTLIIEKQYYGGVCLNVGCIPTKTLLRTAKTYSDIVNKSQEMGISFGKSAKPTIDWSQTLARKDQVVDKLTRGVKSLLTKYKVDQIMGVASAIDAHHINANGKVYGTKHLVIATGSLANKLPLPGFDAGRHDGVVIDSTAILSLPKIPKTLTVIGGGVIGIEFSCLFASLGTKVTIIQGLPTILEMLDQDVTALMTKEVTQKYGINLITNAMVKEMSPNHELIYTVDGKEGKVKSDFVLESVGRHAVLDGFTNLGLAMNDHKGIAVDEHLETNLENVYAIGDVIGKSMLAQVASHSGIVVANRIATKEGKNGEAMVMDYTRVPSCIYTHPEVAMIGQTEQQLKASNTPYKSFKFPFAAIGKALADDETDGFVKILMDPVYKTVLGAHIIGNRATEMISEITTLIECEGTVTELANAIHPHPTMSEAIGETAEALESGMPINL